MLIVLDESGDLGWKFDAPYRRGGSSRYLTIGSLWVDNKVKHKPKRIIKRLYEKYKWDTSAETKWADMEEDQRVFFARKAHDLSVQNTGQIFYTSITVFKENVADHIRRDPNKLYNYMIGLSLIDKMTNYEEISLFPDERSIKVTSGNSLHDYLQIKLWCEKDVSTTLNTIPADSSSNRNVQFADMLAGLVNHHFEDRKSEPFRTLEGSLECKRLYFP